MAWLMRDATVLASVEVADTFATRCRGLLGRDGIDGALLLRPARSVHTLGMRFAIDVAHCDGDLRVLHISRMRPHRVGRPFRRAYVIIEAEAGAFERWGLQVGDELAIEGEEAGPPGPGPRRLHGVGRLLKGWGTNRSPAAPEVPVEVGPGGHGGAPLVGTSGRASTGVGRPTGAAARPPVPRPRVTARRAPRSAEALRSDRLVGATSGSTAPSARSAMLVSPSGPVARKRPSFAPRLRNPRRVRLTVACW